MVSTGGTRKVTRATSSNEGFSKAFVVVLQKASFPFKEPIWQRLIRSFENKAGEVSNNSSSVVSTTGSTTNHLAAPRTKTSLPIDLENSVFQT